MLGRSPKGTPAAEAGLNARDAAAARDMDVTTVFVIVTKKCASSSARRKESMHRMVQLSEAVWHKDGRFTI